MEYLCNDIFMIRVPTLPLRTFFDFNASNYSALEYVSKDISLNHFIKESILISSKSLYQSFINPSNSEKKIKNLNSGISNYMIRASTRPTPFGLLAGVGLGEFSNQTEIIIDQKEYIKDVKVDTHLISHVIHEFQKDINVVSQLKVKFNPICYLRGNRLKNPYFSNHGDIDQYKEHVEENDIQYTGLIELIKGKTGNFIPFSEMKKHIKESYEGVPEGLVDSTMLMLIENEYLITELRIPAYCNNPLEHVIKVLRNKNYDYGQLDSLMEINALITQYKDIDNKSKMIENIYDKMKNVYTTKDYLEVNKGLILNKNYLSYEIKETLERFVECLSMISVSTNEPSSLNKFKETFSEKFGQNIEVPLIHIIDKNEFNGLELMDSSSNLESTERERMIKKIIDNKILVALMNVDLEVKLSKDDFLRIPGIGRFEESAKSFDMNFYITTNSDCLETDLYNISIGPNVGSFKAGKMFQRFHNAFDGELISRYNELYLKEIELTKNKYIIVEARETPVAGRVSNIVSRFKNYESYLSIACTDEDIPGEIPINDLCIGLSQERELYIKSMSLKKRCKVVTDHMLNPNLSSKLLKLLTTISDGYEGKIINRIYNLYANEYAYIPRIKMEGVVIFPRSWNFSINDFNTENLGEFKKSFEGIIQTYKIDEYVYLCESDNRLLINLKKEEALESIYSTIKKDRVLNLREVEVGTFDGSIVKNLNGENYVSEFVFSFIQRKRNDDIPRLSDIREDFVKDNLIFQNENRQFFLGDNGWVYVKLYGIGNRANELLTKELPNLLNGINALKFFFIRYSDGENHLRLRLKFEDENIALNKLHILNFWISELKRSGIINKSVLDVYERETNRYGGLELIECAEEIFYADSHFAIAMMDLFNMDDEEERELAYMIGMISMLKKLTRDEVEIFEFLDEENLRNQYRDEFKKKRSYYIKIVEYIFIGKLEEIDGRLTDLLDMYKTRQAVISNFSSELERQIENKKTTNTKKEIIFSLTHMYCNRMTGIIAYEGKYLSIIRHSLHAIIEKWKYVENK